MNDAVAHQCKGDLLTQFKRYEEALAAYEQAVRLAPNSFAIYFKKGHALRCLGRLEEAEQCYEKARQLRDSEPLG